MSAALREGGTMSYFGRNKAQIQPINIEQQEHKTPFPSSAVGMKSGTTFLISSVQPQGQASQLRLKGVFRKALQQQRFFRGLKVITKAQSVIKMSIIYVEKFIRVMKQQSSSMRFRQCNKNQLSIIADKASNYKYYLIRNYFEKEVPSYLMRAKVLLQRTHIYRWMKTNVGRKWHLDEIDTLILPNSLFFMIWSLFLLVILGLNIIYVPLQISFNDIELSSFANVCLNILPNVCFMLEIIAKFNTAIYKKGLIIKSRQTIILSYISKRFWYDLVIIIFFFLGSYLNKSSLQIALLLRYFDIVQLITELVDRYNLRERFYGIIDLAKLILFILFIAHLCGCIFHYIAYIEITSGAEKTWMGTNVDPLSIPWDIRYVNCLYWSIITMCTLGYGDIVPATPNEKIFTIGVALTSCFVFGFSVNQIGDILKEFFRIEDEFKDKMAKLNIYMKKRDLDDNVSVKVRKYFEYLHKEELLQNTEGASLIDSLEEGLKSEVLKNIYGKILRSKKLFKLNFDVENLAIIVKEKTIGVHEYVYKEGDLGDGIYFLLRGSLEIIKQQTETTFQSIDKGMMFGEIEFFTGQLRQFSVRANSVAQLAYFSKEEFIELMKKSKTEYEKFKRMQDQVWIYQDIQGLDHQCGSCGKYTHLIQQCPQINVWLNKSKTLQAHTLSLPQERFRITSRQKLKTQGGIGKQSLIDQIANTFKINEKVYISEYYNDSNFRNSDQDTSEPSKKQKNQPAHILIGQFETEKYLKQFKSEQKNQKNMLNFQTTVDIGLEQNQKQLKQERNSLKEDEQEKSRNGIKKEQLTLQSEAVSLLGEDLKLNDEVNLDWLLNKNKRKDERQVQMNQFFQSKGQQRVSFSQKSPIAEEPEKLDKADIISSESSSSDSNNETINIEDNDKKDDPQINSLDSCQGSPVKINTSQTRIRILTLPQPQIKADPEKQLAINNPLEKVKNSNVLQVENSSSLGDISRRKVSVMFNSSNTDHPELPINVMLSLNEKDQLREVLELEQNLKNKQSLLKKTQAHKPHQSNSKNNNIQDKDAEQSQGLMTERHNLGFSFRPTSRNSISAVDLGGTPQLIQTYPWKSTFNSFNELTEDYFDNKSSGIFNYSDKTKLEGIELMKYQRIYLKKYDDQFLSEFEKGHEFKEYFPQNNFSRVIDYLNIRMRINPFYKQLLLNKKASYKKKTAQHKNVYKRNFNSLKFQSFLRNSVDTPCSLQNSATPINFVPLQS